MKALFPIILSLIFLAAGTTPTLGSSGASTRVDRLRASLDTHVDLGTVLEIEKLTKSEERAALAPELANRFSVASNPSKVAILETFGHWDVPTSDAMFDQSIADESFEVRRAAVIQFLKTHASLTDTQQAVRFQKTFRLKPYQARLDAMLGFLSLPLDERTKFSSIVDSHFKADCKAETRAEVKQACEKILSSQASSVATKEAK